jgi:rare lipoprotein A
MRIDSAIAADRMTCPRLKCKTRWRATLVVATTLTLVACTPPSKREAVAGAAATSTAASGKPGGYYKDDGPGDHPPANLDAIPDAVPKVEPLSRFSNRPYSVFGVDYVPATTLRPYKERGIASWYGRKFHSQKTSNGETYDMYAMTAAHPTLPLPSYARVTSIATGKSVIVRVNDRGPFHPGRVIDLSFAAAHRIGIAQNGSGQVEVESIIPSDAPPQIAMAPLPSIASAESTPAAPMPVGQEAGAYAVQLGAFANNANAQAFVERVANQVAPLGVQTRVHQDKGLFRVSVGPYATRDEAARVATQLRTALGLDSTIRAQ